MLHLLHNTVMSMPWIHSVSSVFYPTVIIFVSKWALTRQLIYRFYQPSSFLSATSIKYVGIKVHISGIFYETEMRYLFNLPNILNIFTRGRICLLCFSLEKLRDIFVFVIIVRMCILSIKYCRGLQPPHVKYIGMFWSLYITLRLS